MTEFEFAIFKGLIIPLILATLGGLISWPIIKRQIDYQTRRREQVQAIKELFDQFHDVKAAFAEITTKITLYERGLGSQPTNSERLAYDQKAVALRRNIEKKSIYFSEKLTEKMVSCAVAFQIGTSHAHYSLWPDKSEVGLKFRQEQYEELVNLLNGSVFAPIKKEFKSILGSEEE